MWACRWRRLRYRRQVHGTALARCWAIPPPPATRDWRTVDFLVCDAEMSSLELAAGELLSLGWVAVTGGQVQLASAAHHLVQARSSVGPSAGIHHLRDCDLEAAEPEAVVLQRLCEAVRGRVLVFHHAPLDLAYLNRASRRCFGAPLLLPWVDTLALEHRRLARVSPAGGADTALNLGACRRRLNLPDYPAHNALMDALATAELLLAVAAHRSSPRRPARLGDLR